MPLNDREKVLYERLRSWRKERAAQQDTPAFRILGNAVLHHIAYYQPGTLEELLQIKGVGEKKAEHYGKELFAMVIRLQNGDGAGNAGRTD